MWLFAAYTPNDVNNYSKHPLCLEKRPFVEKIW